MSVPYWVQDSIFYQIFPDRFANGDPDNDPPNVQKWGAAPTLWGFQGGDLRGVLQRLDYLLDLGVDALYLNPIFLSPSTHRYNTGDYYCIDPKLGTQAEFHRLLDAAHRSQMRVILDGVFNHCGRGFFAFADLLENGEHSPYKDWFHVRKFPLDAYGPGEAENYLAWWKFKSLPKFNTGNPQVRRYIFDVARYWIEQGADGWRLDVPNEIDDDEFWAEFRQVVKSANPDAYLLGEIWTADPRWVGESHFDGLMNYPLRDALLAALQGKQEAAALAEAVEGLLGLYPRSNVQAMYLPLGSHDTERLLTVLGGDLNKVRTAFQFQMAWPGAPAVYYGDEVGLPGGKDPDCRRAFPWDAGQWQGDLRAWVQILIGLRKRSPALRRGETVRLLADNKLYAFARALGEDKVAAVFNFSPTRQDLDLPVSALWPDGAALRNLMDGRVHPVSAGQVSLSLAPWSGVWLG
jgi:cyclomaltodextrinase / maltogenic alpha-amylase / neopullulanase